MGRDIARYVKSCDVCQRYKVNQQLPAGEMLSKVAQAPWEIVCGDFIGPLPRSKHGNNMLLVFVDKFSKWVELIPLRTATHETLQKAFRERILARFGTPKVFISDNGTQFTSKKFQNYLKDLGVHHQLTAPYTPQENPTERANRTIKTIIAQISGNDQRKWDESLAEITLALNSSTSDTTGYSAAYLVQGRELRLPSMLFHEVALGPGHVQDEGESKAKHLEEIFTIVRRNLVKAAETQAKHYNLRRRKWKPAVGDKVLIKQHHLSKAVEGFAAKLAPRFDGPYVVQRYVSPVIIEAKNISDGRVKTAHLSQVKSYHMSAQENNATVLNTQQEPSVQDTQEQLNPDSGKQTRDQEQENQTRQVNQ